MDPGKTLNFKGAQYVTYKIFGTVMKLIAQLYFSVQLKGNFEIKVYLKYSGNPL